MLKNFINFFKENVIIGTQKRDIGEKTGNTAFLMLNGYKIHKYCHKYGTLP